MGFTEELTRQIVTLQPVEFKGRPYSKEHREKLDVYKRQLWTNQVIIRSFMDKSLPFLSGGE